MSGVAKTIGKIAGVVAAVTAFIPGLQPVALIAAGVSAAANITASAIGSPAPQKPAIQGSISNITIGADQATPMMIGNIYSGGALVHQAGYGAAVDGVSNPYLAMAVVYSAGGPIAGIDSFWSDFAQLGYSGSPAAGAATGYFNGFLYWRSQTGATPEAASLAAHWGGLPGWGGAYKLSGYAATLWSLKWDSKQGKFTSGVPRIGIKGRGVLTWDPRKDSTWPGGSGSHRWVDPRANPAGFAAAKASWAYSGRPGLHALRYALGTWERDPAAASDAPWILTYGVGIPVDGLVVADFIELENVCEANGWTCDGILLEPGDKWANLKRILEAGGAQPCFKGGRLGCKITAPRVALDTIGRDDIADGTIEAAGAQPRTDRINTVVPKFRSPAHKWELQQSDEIVISDYLAEDGEEKRREEAFEFVTNATQAAQLATYRLFDSREQGPIELRCKPRLRRYAGGDMLTLTDDLREDLGLAQNNVVVLRRAVDPITMVVTLTLVTENQLKHLAAMAVTGNAPATITLPTTQQIDQNSGVNDVLQQIELLAEDGVLTRFEKITRLIPLSVQLADRWNLLDVQAAALTGFAEVVSARSAANAAYSAWISYRNGLSPAWNDVGADTVVTRGTYDDRINTLQAALDALDQAIKRAEVNSNTLLIEAAQALAAGKGKPWFAATPPGAAESGESDIWFDTSAGNLLYRRLPGNGRISYGGTVISYGAAGAVVYPPWTPAPDQRIAAALADAAQGIAKANAAQAAADAAAARLSVIDDDGIITGAEKRTSLKPDAAELAASWAAEDDLAAGYGITDERTAAGNARTAWLAQLAAIPYWQDESVDSPVDRVAYQAALDGYRAALIALAKANNAAAAKRAEYNLIAGAKPPVNADNTALNQVTVSIAQSIEVPADYTGAIAAGTLPRIALPTVKRGGQDVTTTAAIGYFLSGYAGGCSAANMTVNNVAGSPEKGQVSVLPGWTSNGSAILYVTADGTVIGSWQISVTLKRAQAPSGGGSGSSGYVKTGTASVEGLAVTSTAYVERGRIANMQRADGETIRASLSANYSIISGRGQNAVYAKWQYSPAGANSWTDFPGGAATGSYARWIYNDPGGIPGAPLPDEPPLWDISDGDVTLSSAATPPAGNYDVRLMLALRGVGPSLTITDGVGVVEIRA